MQDPQNQQTIYYIILLVFLVASLFFRRELKLSQALKYLAIWSVIILIGVVGYSYRYEFFGFKNRVLGELNPALARIDAKKRLVINLSRDGHFYINTKINNKAIRFMIDTGASDIMLNHKDAALIGFKNQDLIFNKRYQTANGEVFGAIVNLDKIEIGGVIFRNLKASVNSADLGVSLLGMSFLRQFKRYEFYRDRLILEFYGESRPGF